MIKNSYKGINREKRTLLEVIDLHNEKFQENVDKDKRKGSTFKNWDSTKDKISAFLTSVFKMKNIPLAFVFLNKTNNGIEQ